MDDSSNLDTVIELIQNDIDRFERELKLAKKFDALFEDENFQEVIMESLLGSEAEELAKTLLEVSVDDERSQEILLELKSLKFLRELLLRKANESEMIQARLDESKQLLLDTAR